MFSSEADWKRATTLICDVLRGTSSLGVETRSSVLSAGERKTHSSRWRYDQTQPHQSQQQSVARLFSPEQLLSFLQELGKAEVFLAYETSPLERLGDDVDAALAEFSSVKLSLVNLTVGAVALSWVLVSLGEPRDLLLWKLKYHLRDTRL